jgi:hypothetical protein
MKDYNRDLFRHNQELTVEVEHLKNEVQSLKKYKSLAHELQAKLDRLESSIEDRIAKAVSEAVSKATEPLYAIIAEKDKEILRLKSQLGKDSSNSSKPPSGNGFKHIPNNREKSGKKQGGHKDNAGVYRTPPRCRRTPKHQLWQWNCRSLCVSFGDWSCCVQTLVRFSG